MNTNMEKNAKKGLDFNTVDYSADGTALRIIDQTLLPGKMKFLELRAREDIRDRAPGGGAGHMRALRR